MNIGKYYALRINPETKLSTVSTFVDSIIYSFGIESGNNDMMKSEILEAVTGMKEDNCYGRLYFDYETGVINIKEDNLKL